MTPDQFNAIINLIQTGAAGAKEMFIWWLATLAAGLVAIRWSEHWSTVRNEQADTLERIAEILNVRVDQPYYQTALRQIVAAVEKLKAKD